MKEVSEGQGRTVLFVSHNMAAVRTLCNNGMVLVNGKVTFQGDSALAVSNYLKGGTESMNCRTFGDEFNNDEFALYEISLNSKGKTSEHPLDEYDEIELHIKIDNKKNGERRRIILVLHDEKGDPLFAFTHFGSGVKLIDGMNELVCSFPKNFLNVGSYNISFHLIEDAQNAVFVEKDIMTFDIQEGKRNLGRWMGKEPGFIKPVFEWKNII